ncbi:MAG: glucose-1-phosphate adenylyltransferase, partial [Dethiosulfovibrio peptidovorans]
PAEPPEIPGRPGFSYVSMGNYVFEREILEGALLEDASIQQTSHDFGRDIIPRLVNRSRVFAYDFSTNVLPPPPGHHWREDKPYWRDVGTIQSYWQAHMDLLEVDSEMTLYNPNWPIRTVSFADPPAFTHPSESSDYEISNTLIAEGSRILGARVNRSVLSRNCIILPGAQVDECVIGQGVVIGRNCRLRRAIIDSHNEIPSGTIIGDDASTTYAPGPSGITTVAMPQMRLRKKQELSQDSEGWITFS